MNFSQVYHQVKNIHLDKLNMTLSGDFIVLFTEQIHGPR